VSAGTCRTLRTGGFVEAKFYCPHDGNGVIVATAVLVRKLYLLTNSCAMQLIRREDTTLLGLVLLNIASEELACPRDDLVAARKQQLYVLMLHEVPAIFAVLNG